MLAPEDTFFAATNGEGGMRRCGPAPDAFGNVPSFTLQNGRGILSPFFPSVEREDYRNSLGITRTGDLIAWPRSSLRIASGYGEKDLDELARFFEGIRRREGAIRIPTEAGLFDARK